MATREEIIIKMLASGETVEMKDLKDAIWPAVHPVNASNNLTNTVAHLRKKGFRIERVLGYRLNLKQRRGK